MLKKMIHIIPEHIRTSLILYACVVWWVASIVFLIQKIAESRKGSGEWATEAMKCKSAGIIGCAPADMEIIEFWGDRFADIPASWVVSCDGETWVCSHGKFTECARKMYR